MANNAHVETMYILIRIPRKPEYKNEVRKNILKQKRLLANAASLFSSKTILNAAFCINKKFKLNTLMNML